MGAPRGNKFAAGIKDSGPAKRAGIAAAKTIRESLAAALPHETEVSEWKAWLQHPDPKIRWEAFKLAMAYRYDKPAQPVNSAPLHVEPITMKIEHIGASAEFFAKQAAILGLK